MVIFIIYKLLAEVIFFKYTHKILNTYKGQRYDECRVFLSSYYLGIMLLYTRIIRRAYNYVYHDTLRVLKNLRVRSKYLFIFFNIMKNTT